MWVERDEGNGRGMWQVRGCEEEKRMVCGVGEKEQGITRERTWTEGNKISIIDWVKEHKTVIGRDKSCSFHRRKAACCAAQSLLLWTPSLILLSHEASLKSWTLWSDIKLSDAAGGPDRGSVSCFRGKLDLIPKLPQSHHTSLLTSHSISQLFID